MKKKLLLVILASLSLAQPAGADWLGSRAAGSTVHGNFTTLGQAGLATLGGTPALSAYKNASGTQSTCGFTLSADHDGVTGLNNFILDTSCDGSFYAAGGHFAVVITTGTVDGQSRVGYVVAEFCIECASIGTVALNGITASSIAADAIGASEVGSDAIGASELAANAIGSSEVADGAVDAGAIATGAVDADAVAADAVTEIAAGISVPSSGTVADAVWDEALSGHATAGSAGAALSAAGAAGDPWSTALPGSYAAGTAGEIIGNIVPDLSATGVTVTNPVAASGTLTVKQGDDYSLSDTRAIEFSHTGSYDPSSPTSITLRIYNFAIGVASWTGTVVGSASPWTLRFQPTANQTGALVPGGSYRYDIEVVKNGRKVTVSEGTCIVTVN